MGLSRLHHTHQELPHSTRADPTTRCSSTNKASLAIIKAHIHQELIHSINKAPMDKIFKIKIYLDLANLDTIPISIYSSRFRIALKASMTFTTRCITVALALALVAYFHLLESLLSCRSMRYC